MFIVDDVIDAGGDFVDAALDLGNAATDAIQDNLIDPVVEAAEDIGEWIDEEIIERAGVAIAEFGDLLEEAAKKAQEGFMQFVEGAKNTFIDFANAIESAAHGFIEGAIAAWDWVTEQVMHATEWLVNAATKIVDMIIEKVIPYILDVLEFAIAVVVFIAALILLPICVFLNGLINDDEAEVIKGIAEHDSRVMDEFNVERRPSNQQYVVFSDVHMFVAHDLDFFNGNGNSQIYHHALNHYAAAGYTLIENGDVEDFWMRDNQALGAISTVSDQLPWPYYADAFREQAIRTQHQSHAFQMFLNNANTYALIRKEFHDKNRYVRTIGNHDDAWDDAANMEIMDLIYPGIVVNDYCTLDGTNGEANVVLAHGHQSDIFNMPMCAWAGKAAANAASRLYELSFGEANFFWRPKDEWEDEFEGNGFDNELVERNIIKFVSFDEVGLYKDLEDIYGNSSTQPFLILSHTHNVRDESGVPDWMYTNEWTWKHYANTGTAGMWEQIVTGLEVNWPSVKAVAWLRNSNGAIARRELSSYQYGDYYLQPV